MPLAVITFKQILELLGLIVVVHALILAPAMIAIVGAWGERNENRRDFGA